jgi:hypothetical protein
MPCFRYIIGKKDKMMALIAMLLNKAAQQPATITKD